MRFIRWSNLLSRSCPYGICLFIYTSGFIYINCLWIIFFFYVIYVECRTVYDNVRYCERFHLNESGWRECNSCEKVISDSTILEIYKPTY